VPELKTARAWAMKETAMSLYTYTYEGPACKHFRWWYGWAVRSRLAPMIQVAGMLKRRFENIITYLKHRITNAASESINSKIQWVKYTARDFRNKQNSSTRSTSTAVGWTSPQHPLNSPKRPTLALLPPPVRLRHEGLAVAQPDLQLLFPHIRAHRRFGNPDFRFSAAAGLRGEILH
jgi:hypothetical protein